MPTPNSTDEGPWVVVCHPDSRGTAVEVFPDLHVIATPLVPKYSIYLMHASLAEAVERETIKWQRARAHDGSSSTRMTRTGCEESSRST